MRAAQSHLVFAKKIVHFLSIFFLFSHKQFFQKYGLSGFPVFLQRSATSREYLYTGLKQLINLGLLENDYLIAYIGGAYGEGRGTSFLEINRVGDILADYDTYLLPNLESTQQCATKKTN